MINAIPTWVYTFIAVALIASVIYITIKTSGGIKKPARLFVITLITVGYIFALTFVQNVKPQLGLDLQGGVSVTLLAKGNPSSKSVDVAVSIIRERVDGLGVAEPEISRQGNNIVVDLPGAKDSKRAEETIGQTAKLYFRQVAENNYDFSTQSGSDPEVQQDGEPKTATTKAVATTTTSKPESAKAGSLRAADETTTTTTTSSSPTTTPVSSPSEDAPVAQIPTKINVQCGGTSPKTFTLSGDLSNFTTRINDKPDVPIIARDKMTGLPKLLCPAVLGGDIVADAYKSVDGQGGISTAVELKSKSSNQFTEKIGKPLSGKPVAIVLDSVVQSDPVIQPDLANGLSNNTISITFGNQKNVSGEAEKLAQVLKFGALPVVLEQQTAQKISPTLGTDQLNSGLLAGAIGLLLVFIFMFFYYRVLALVVFIGVLLSGMTTYALIAWLGSTQGLSLTLAGIVGLIVSLGVTVDSYIVYFEKLKDEVRHGRSVRSSLDSGFKSAFRTILAADLISLFGAITLFYLAAGSVRGFAFFLGVSTALDILFSVCFMHPFVKLLAMKPKLITNRHYGFAVALDNKDITV